MIQRRVPFILATILSGSLVLADGLAASQPAALTAFHRSGQTFLTWTEDTTISGEMYHVYRHTEPVTTANLAQAARLTERWGPLPEGSSIFYTDRDRDQGASLFPGLRNYVIIDLGPQLADTTGLFVWTPKQAGPYYYAVTVVEGAVETLPPGNSLAGPVSETVADPEPVLAWQSPSGLGRVFTQFMDFDTFNPTFERPWPHPDGGLQYAYNYFVGLPTGEQCGGTLPDSLPVILHIEGHGSRYLAEPGDNSSYYCAIEIWGDDPRQSWYFGFSSTHDYRTGDPSSDTPASGPIVNYAEERLLRAVYDTLRDPDYAAYHLDPNRIYTYGHSMGGGGALALAMRYPNVIAASYSSEPITDFRDSGMWVADIAPKIGSPESNFPIEIRGRYAAHLVGYNGTGAWDWQDHQAQLAARRGDEMAHISLAHGTLDEVLPWPTQGQPTYAQFYLGRRAFSGAIVEAEHTWVGFNGLGPNVAELNYAPFYALAFRRDETIPALSYASGSSPVPPPGAGAGYNLNLEWSSSWDNWDGPPVDTPGEWAMSLRTTDGSTQTVDVTPRRIQHFLTAPGTFTWENHRVSDDTLVATGSVSLTADGLIIVPAFQITPAGNRLVLRPGGSGNLSPTASFTATPSSGPPPLEVQLDGSGSSDQDGQIVSYQWTFGDGQSGSGAVVAHSYASSGSYTATLVVTDDDGATGQASRPILVSAPPAAARPWPDTSYGIHVFNDQFSGDLSDAQVRFCATHFAGTQKMTRIDADRLRAVNPGFLILHYRLAIGLGYRAAVGACLPTGDWLRVIEGNDWVQEWPGDASVQENWFYHWPEESATRLYQCDWGWYLTDVADPAYRAWWRDEVLRQLQANDADGLFMDSANPPSYMGNFNPALPDVDPDLESTWSTRVTDWLHWLQAGPVGDYYIVPNLGAWITSRETTDYSPADGLMIEGFAMSGDATPHDFTDWRLQMDRVLGAVARGQAILGQTYVSGIQERMFTLGSYLLVKGNRTYYNIDLDLPPEWWPEYEIPIGAPSHGASGGIDSLDPDGDGIYRRDFENALVLVNPTSPWDGTAVTRTVEPGGTWYRVVATGGGFVGVDGSTTGSLTYEPVTQVTLGPVSAVVLFDGALLFRPGDLDVSGQSDAIDLVILSHYLVGNLLQGPPPFTAPAATADLDHDTRIEAADLLLLSLILSE